MEKAYLKYIMALLLFGSNGIVASYILLSSYEIVFYRTLIGSIFLIVLLVVLKYKPRQLLYKKKAVFFVSCSGIAMGFSWICLFEAYVRNGVGISTLLYYCGPVLVIVVAPFIFKERLTKEKVFGIFIVLIGMFCLNGQSIFNGGLSLGFLFGIGAAILYAAMVIFNKKAIELGGLENATVQLTVSFITVAIFLSFRQGIAVTISEENIIPIILLGIVNTGVGCYFYFSSISKLPIQSVSILGYLEPLSAVVFSMLILGEALNPIQLVGAFLILGGAAFAKLFRPKRVVYS